MQTLPAQNPVARFPAPDVDAKLRIITENAIRYIEDLADAEGVKNPLSIRRIIRALAVEVERSSEKAGARRVTRGGLAPWQERRAKEKLIADLSENTTLDELARECRMSVSHFARAFRQTTGVTAHQWLMNHRVEAAKEILRDRTRELSEIALSCGFADQSHFTRAFSRAAGMPPGAWRRNLGEQMSRRD